MLKKQVLIKWRLFQQREVGLTLEKSVTAFHHIIDNRMKRKTYIIISLYAEKSTDKSKH